MKKVLFTLLAAAIFELAAAQAVRDRLAAISAGPMQSGFKIPHDEATATLADGASTTFHLTLYEDTEYLILGAGDADSRRLTLSVYDENYHKIDLSDGQDTFPMLQIRPKWTGIFHVKVNMTECRAATCVFGLRFLEQE